MSYDIGIDVDEVAIGYVADMKGVLPIGLSWWEWKKIFSDSHHQRNDIKRLIPQNLKKEAFNLKSSIKDAWCPQESKVLTWLQELTQWSLPDISIHICVVPFQCSQVPFPGLPFIFLGYIRKGWHYPETIAHELAHILFNCYSDLSTEEVHPLIQLIEEEIAVRLGNRSTYFDYDIPPCAHWVKKAQEMEEIWKDYLNQKEFYKNIADLARFIV